jgi:DNA-directed RNA polymerase specialized sigma24 family protein
MSHPEREKAPVPNGQDEAGTSASESEGSVAGAIARYHQGDDSELGALVFRLHSQLVARAQAKLSNAPYLRSTTDGEDAASSALGSYWKGIGVGKFQDMKHTNQLLALLCTIVDRKVSRRKRKHATAKAGSGKVQGEPEFGLELEGREPEPLDVLIERDNLLQLEAVIEEWRSQMQEKGLLEVAELHLKGHGYREIAAILSIGENKARRMITLVNALTRDFEQDGSLGP